MWGFCRGPVPDALGDAEVLRGTSERPIGATEIFDHVVRAPHLLAAVPHTKIIRSRKRAPLCQNTKAGAR